MFEKRFAAVPAQLFTANGTTDGTVTIAADACSLFKVKQKVIITATGQPNLTVEIKEIANGVIKVGPLPSAARPANPNGPNKPAVQNSLLLRSDISAYTVVAGAAIMADEQRRPDLDYAEVMRAVYDEEPTTALRTTLVDDCGDKYNAENPLPVAFDGTISIGDVSIVQGGNTMDVNSDGSINVNVVNSTPTSTPGLTFLYQEISSVASGLTTPIYTFVTPSPGYRMFRIDVSGENIALFTIVLNGTTIMSKRTFYGELNTSFSFEDFTNGLKLNTGDQLVVNVLHNRPFTGNFEATLMGVSL